MSSFPWPDFEFGVRSMHQGNVNSLLPCLTTKEQLEDREKGKLCVSCLDSLADDFVWNCALKETGEPLITKVRTER